MSKKTESDYIGKNYSGYIVNKYIAHGGFGMVFKGTTPKGLECAIKIPIEQKKYSAKSIVQEAAIYEKINSDAVISATLVENVLVMDLLKGSIQHFFQKVNKKFRMKTVILIATKAIKCIQSFHESGYIHRDIKPDNFGVTKENGFKLVDLGLAVPVGTKSKSFCGTARYSSISAHLKEPQTYKDDLESLGYVLVYLYKGSLPWSRCKKEDDYKEVLKLKQTASNLTYGMPKEFRVYLDYVKSLDPEDTPHYNSCRRMFEKLFKKKGYTNENFDLT